ncbi:MAG: hypothetical protein ACOVQN_00405 [Exiguobacterium sp.]
MADLAKYLVRDARFPLNAALALAFATVFSTSTAVTRISSSD